MAWNEDTTDLFIAGGGMVGASLAAALSASHLDIALAELRPRARIDDPDPLERVSLIAEGSVRFLQRIGVWPENFGTPVRKMWIWDADRFGNIAFDAEEIGATRLGVIVENRRLEQALHTFLGQCPRVAVQYGRGIDAVYNEPDGVTVMMEGAVRRTRLLAVAEGRDSRLRRAMGIGTLRSDYGQRGIIASVGIERPHNGVAYQRFLPSGPVALLPFSDAPDGSPRCSIVWSARQDLAQTLMALDDDAFLARLNTAFGPQLGRITAVGRRAAFPLGALHADSYIGHHSVLLGDTAHGVHPLAGLGVNLGLRDADCLAELVLEAAANGRDWGDRNCLRRYEAARRPDNLATLAFTDGLHRLFSNDFPPLAWLRDAGLLAVQVTPPVKRFFIRQAMGLSPHSKGALS